MNYKFKTKPYAHQITALEKSWNKENFAYFMEMGTGKTKVLIDNVAMLYDKGKIDGVLIIAPKGVVKTWYEQELPTHLPDHIENVSVLWQPNITKTQREKLESLFEIESAFHILVMFDCHNMVTFSIWSGKCVGNSCSYQVLTTPFGATIKTPSILPLSYNIATLSINTFVLPVPISIKYAKFSLFQDFSNAVN